MGLAWLPLALLSYSMQAVTSAVDRIVVHKEVTKPIVISFWVAAFSVATIGILAIGLLPVPFAEEFKFEMPPSTRILLYVIASGVMSQVGLLFMYRSYSSGEVTRVTSVMGAVTPIVALIASYFYLDERLSSLSYLAVLLLIAGTVVLTLQIGSKRPGSYKWVINAIVAAIVLSLQSVLMKIVFDEYQFISAYAMTSIGALLYMTFLVLVFKDVRNAVFASPAPKKKKKKKGPKSQVLLIISNAALGGMAVIILNLSIKLGSPTFINALRGVQYAVVFLIAIALASKFPKLLDEELNKKVLLVKLSGIVLVVNGVVLLAIQSNA